MRGQLRISSARSPYLRAGLAWPTTAPVELHISVLDGERFLRLVKDPVLTIQMSDEDGKFALLPAIDDDLTVDVAQMMIDKLAEFAPAPDATEATDVPSPDEVKLLREIEAAWHADQRHLHDQGFQTLDALTSAWAVDRATTNAKDARIAELSTSGRRPFECSREGAGISISIDDQIVVNDISGVVFKGDLEALAARCRNAAKPATGKAKPKPAD